MPKVVVTKAHYDEVRRIEKRTGRKIKVGKLCVIDEIGGQWGIWQVKRCYKSINKYIADMELVVAATSEIHAIMLFQKGVDEHAQKGFRTEIIEGF